MKKIIFTLVFLLTLSLVYAQEAIENAKNEPLPAEDIPIQYPQQQEQPTNGSPIYEENTDLSLKSIEQINNSLLPSEPIGIGPIVNESESVQYNIPADLKEAIKAEKMKEEAENIEIFESESKSTVIFYVIGAGLGVIVLFALLKKLIKRDKTTKKKLGKKSKRKK